MNPRCSSVNTLHGQPTVRSRSPGILRINWARANRTSRFDGPVGWRARPLRKHIVDRRHGVPHGHQPRRRPLRALAGFGKQPASITGRVVAVILAAVLFKVVQDGREILGVVGGC
jgi:hypothetical protein